MIRRIKFIITAVLFVFLLLILLSPALAADVWNATLGHFVHFGHLIHFHGPHLRSPVGNNVRH